MPVKQYKALPVDSQQDTTAARRDALAILKGGALGDDQKKQLIAYYDGAAFARWTRPSDYASIPDFRKQLAAELRAARNNQAVSDYLLGLTISRMKEFIKPEPEYHPVVRYNAMLVIGELSTAQGPPLPEAQAVLLSELNNPNQNDLVLAAVLIGMIRHCTAGFPDADVRDKQVVAPLLKLAQAPAAPARSSESHAWLRSLAVDALAALRYPGSNGAVAQTLANLVSDDTVSPMVRMSAAKALGNLDYQAAAGGLKPLDLLGALVKMTEDVCKTERKRPPPPPPSASSDGGRPGYGGMPRRPYRPRVGGAYPGPYGMPAEENLDDPDHVLQFRRRLKTQLNAVKIGLGIPSKTRATGVAALFVGTGDEQEKAVRNMYNVLNDLFTKVLDDPDLTLAEMNKKIDEKISTLNEDLNKLRGAGGPAPVPAATQPAVKTAPAEPAKGAPAEPAKPPATP